MSHPYEGKDHGFRVGDKLRCIENWGSGSSSHYPIQDDILIVLDADEASRLMSSPQHYAEQEDWLYLKNLRNNYVDGYKHDIVVDKFVIESISTTPISSKVEGMPYCSCADPTLVLRNAAVGGTSIPYRYCTICKNERR
jgi:hypothetical protein